MRAFALLLFTTLIAGCTLEYVYNRADRFLIEFVDDHLDLTPSQEDWLSERLKRQLATHRVEQLPSYARFLNNVADRFLSGIQEDEYAVYLQQVRDLRSKLVKSLLPDAVELIKGISSEQIDKLQQELDRRNQKTMAEYIDKSPDKRRAKQIEWLLEFFDQWLGGATDAQRSFIDAEINRMPEAAELWFSDRKQRQANLIDAMRSGDSAAIRIALRQYAAPEAEDISPALRARLNERKPYFARIYAQVSKQMNDSQKRHLRAEVDKLTESMHRLAQR
jgi:hypothetical protein